MKVAVQKEILIEKCDECDKYGTITALDYPDDPENSGSYSPHCDCEFGKWQKDHQETRDMFCLARQGG